MKRNLFAIGLAFLVASVTARADVVVLVHGYLGDASSWDRAGVTAALAADGWQPSGVLIAGPGGIQQLPSPFPVASGAVNRLYQVNLPSIAPVMLQVNLLQAMLDRVVTLHPGQKIHLVGHSAGGVVARAAAVQRGGRDLASLITIGSPHLGTFRAGEALDETSGGGPIGWIKDFFGGGLYHTVKDSRGLLVDLLPVGPGSLLDWLNRQPHPSELRYVAILRSGPVGLGDELVPVYSQDLNQVPALNGRAERVTTPASHVLNPADGALLAELL